MGLPPGVPASALGLDYTSAINCLVMVAKRLEVGYFRSDRGGLYISEWSDHLDRLAKALYELLLSELPTLDVETLLEEKIVFFDLCYKALKEHDPKTLYV